VVRLAPAALLLLADGRAHAVDAFEIQVYDGTANAPGVAGLEVHINGVPVGMTTAPPPELPPDGMLHLTFEPSLGITSFWELGGYLQTALQPDGEFDFAGVKLRSKLVTPPGWRPWSAQLRLGCNFEVSYLPAKFEADRWGGEIRPIVAWWDARWLVAVNPIVDVSLTGSPPTFDPAAEVTIRLGRYASVGLEYYAGLGTIGAFSPWRQQQQYIFQVANLFIVPGLELNLGIGEGLTPASNPLTVKGIIGYEIDWFPLFGPRAARGR